AASQRGNARGRAAGARAHDPAGARVRGSPRRRPRQFAFRRLHQAARSARWSCPSSCLDSSLDGEYDLGTGVRDAAARLEPHARLTHDRLQPRMCTHVPATLVARRQEDEPGPAPPVRKIAGSPSGTDREPDLAALVLLRQDEPLRAPLDVTIQRVIAEAVLGDTARRLRLHVCHDGAVQVVQPEHLHLEQHSTSEQRRFRIEVCRDDGRVRELEAAHRQPAPLERAVVHGQAGPLGREQRIRAIAVPAPLARHHVVVLHEVAPETLERAQPVEQLSNRPAVTDAVLRHQSPRARNVGWCRPLHVSASSSSTSSTCALISPAIVQPSAAATRLMKSVHVLVCIASPIATYSARRMFELARARLRMWKTTRCSTLRYAPNVMRPASGWPSSVWSVMLFVSRCATRTSQRPAPRMSIRIPSPTASGTSSSSRSKRTIAGGGNEQNCSATRSITSLGE